MRGPHLLVLGPPGAGKGTQCSRIAEEYDVEHITTGDALRERKTMETDYGTPQEYMEAGELVPDPVVNEIVRAALEAADGFVLDGYPRTIEQAEYLDSITDLDAIVHLSVPTDELIRRLTGRRVCPDCGANYHVEFAPPETDGVCDECGGELVQRDDDTEDTVKERLAVYERETEPVIEYYDDHPGFEVVDGDADPDAVWQALSAAIDRHLA